jgi:DNA-binding helix-hairpin-helix protein with protein kinase domain
MTVAEGSTVWGVRVSSQPEEWRRFTVGKQVAEPGRFGVVHRLADKTDPPLVAKFYINDALDNLRSNLAYRQRIVALAHHRYHLSHGNALPFAVWPRRILFTSRDPSEVDIPRTIVGFSMAALPVTRSLKSLFDDPSARLRLTSEDSVHIAAILADQLARMHRHPWRFVFGDLSPNNIHVTHDFKRVYFIDTDGYQFQFNAPRLAFRPPGVTPTYISPGSRQRLESKRTLGPAHDEFVLAILIFQILMMLQGRRAPHPFGSLDGDENDYIDQRVFPYAVSHQHPPPNQALAVYNAFPADIRAAFMQTFTTPLPFPASRWPELLSRYRRGLRRP